MGKLDKIKIAITAGIFAVILLILIAYLAVSGTKSRSAAEDEQLASNIIDYANKTASDDYGVGSFESSGSSSSGSSQAGSGEASSAMTSQEDTSEYKDPEENTVSGNSFYATNTAVLKDVYKKVSYDRGAQLKEMHDYWADGNMDAVRELAHLERYEAMTYSLKDSSDFYYYGEKDDKDVPNGKGLAVYADDQYYFGEFKDGKRSGEGTWISFYPSYSHYVVTEHSYSGVWEEDVPNGKGQEHYDYNTDNMNSADIYLQNVIGNFKNGLYDEEMFFITIDKDGDTTDWNGYLHEGKFTQSSHASKDKKGKIPVLNMATKEDMHIYMTEEGLENNGITGIINGGEVKE